MTSIMMPAILSKIAVNSYGMEAIHSSMKPDLFIRIYSAWPSGEYHVKDVLYRYQSLSIYV